MEGKDINFIGKILTNDYLLFFRLRPLYDNIFLVIEIVIVLIALNSFIAITIRNFTLLVSFFIIYNFFYYLNDVLGKHVGKENDVKREILVNAYTFFSILTFLPVSIVFIYKLSTEYLSYIFLLVFSVFFVHNVIKKKKIRCITFSLLRLLKILAIVLIFEPFEGKSVGIAFAIACGNIFMWRKWKGCQHVMAPISVLLFFSSLYFIKSILITAYIAFLTITLELVRIITQRGLVKGK